MALPVIALDLATTTGWALRDREGRIASGVQKFELKRGESKGMRFLRFRKWLREILELGQLGKEHSENDPGILIYEQPHHRGGFSTELCVGLATDAMAEAANLSLEHAAIHTGTLKKWATGKGNAGKPAMIARAKEIYPNIDIIDDNHADALLLLRYSIEEIT